MALITMSKKELGRLETLIDLVEGRITAAQAAGLIGVGERQVFRLLKAYRTRGAEGLVSRRRGRPSNRRYPEPDRESVLATIHEHYADFGPTLAAEKLAEVHGLRLGRETVRRWMAAAGLWVPRKERRRRIHQPRHRRDCLGELVKELRLAGVSTLEAANAFLPAFMAAYNARFAKEPRQAEDVHRPLPATADLDEVMTVREAASG